MIQEKVAAVIVTYNPDMELLKKNIGALAGQVAMLLIFDNGSDNAGDVEALLDNISEVQAEICLNKRNIGLPINYNKAAQRAKQLGLEWLLIMDQDTVIPPDMIDIFSDAIEKYGEILAIVAPVVCDINIQTVEEVSASLPKEKYSLIEECISSASLNRIDTIIELGGFDEQMFIDWVDYDYCRNVREHGLLIARANECIIEHQIGKSEIRKLLWKHVTVYHHPPKRKYYFFRNRVYFARKYKLSPIREWKYYRTFIKYLILNCYEDNGWKKTKASIKGIVDGFKMIP